MTDTEFQAQLERALTWAGIWSSTEPCQSTRNINGLCLKHKTFLAHMDRNTCPLLTDELALKLLYATPGKGYLIHIRTNLGDVPAWRYSVWASTLDSEAAITNYYPSNDIRCAIVLAVAAIAEQKQGKQR